MATAANTHDLISVKYSELPKTGAGWRQKPKVIWPGSSDSFLRGWRTAFCGALTSISFASRFLSIALARSTTSRGSPAIAATCIPNDFSATVLNGVNFVMIDDSANTVSADQASRFEAEAKKGLPIILCMHCPFPTREIVLAASRFWRSKGNLKAIRDMDGYVEKYKDGTTQDFVAYLRAQPLLKGILCGHGHIGVVSPFSPTAKQYEVAGNFMFHAQEFTVS